MRMIDADALMELARNHVNKTVDCNDIARFPTIDAAPVVRCRDCKDYERDCGYCDYWEVSRNYDDYCSRGAKMDGGVSDEAD